MDKRFAATLAILLAACSSPTGPQPTPLTAIARPQPVKVLWSESVGDGERYVFSPAFADGAVYAAARNGTVSRFDATSGRRTWSVTAGERLSGGVGTDGRIVAVANEDGEVFALDAASGQKRWTAGLERSDCGTGGRRGCGARAQHR